jgi:hypothetical protein
MSRVRMHAPFGLLLLALAAGDQVTRTKARDRPAGVPVEESANWVFASAWSTYRILVHVHM